MFTSPVFYLNAVALGIGLAMDAFCVSMANGLNEPLMKKSKSCAIAGTFGFFQIMMPLIGWLCIQTIAEKFKEFQAFIPWIALILLLYIGGKMLISGIRNKETPEAVKTGAAALFVQGVATSIDALSVGFTIADYRFAEALTEAVIIGVVTFANCMGGLKIGKTFGTKLAGKASVVGGIILIAIGIEIFVKGMLG